jgi:hypothetical protein
MTRCEHQDRWVAQPPSSARVRQRRLGKGSAQQDLLASLTERERAFPTSTDAVEQREQVLMHLVRALHLDEVRPDQFDVLGVRDEFRGGLHITGRGEHVVLAGNERRRHGDGAQRHAGVLIGAVPS